MRIRVPFNDKPLSEAETQDMALDSDYVIPKMLPEHYDEIEFTFTEEPLNVTEYELFHVDFDFDYVPMAHVLMSGPASIFGTEDFYFLEQFTIVPQQQFVMKIERDQKRLAVYYVWPNGSAPAVPVNGTTWRFRYYIYVEGDDDVDFEEVSKTI